MAEPFKNVYNQEFVEELSFLIYSLDSTFKKEAFEKTILKQIQTLELKQRMRLISFNIHHFWPKDYLHQLSVLLQVKEKLNKDKHHTLASMVFPDFVEQFGLDHFEVSLNALENFTIHSSSEFAIRHFIIKDEQQTMQKMRLWTQSSNEHIRRLASEGCRPRLPWAIALQNFKQNPKEVFKILELLKNDTSAYVRKSVANNLNDISKDHPQMVISFIKDNLHQNKHLDWILKHGARTLLKASNKETLELFGYKNTNLNLTDLNFQSSVKKGEEIPFSFTINSSQNLGQIRIEYAVDFVRKNNKTTRKVFHISTANIDQKTKYVQSKHSFKNITTRNYYVGLHIFYIIINGTILTQFEVNLTA